jgi:ATP-binding cassette, subfamily A (ABC1), member 3
LRYSKQTFLLLLHPQSSESLFATSNVSAATQYGAIWYTRGPSSTIVGTNNTNFVDSVVTQCNLIAAEGLNYSSPSDCSRFKGYEYVIQYNFTAIHVAPLFQSFADQALVRYATGNPSVTISTTIAPLPITKPEESFGAAEDLTLVWFLIMLVFPFIGGSFASFVVYERESKAKHLQTVAGVEPTSYWISTFLWDTLNYQIPLWIIVALMFIFKVDALTTTENNTLSGVIAILFLYGPASAGYAYCISFAFTSPSLCFIFLVVSSILIGFGGPLAIFILLIIGNGSPGSNLTNVAHILEWVLRPFPAFCLGKGLFFVINTQTISFFEGDPNQSLSAWNKSILLIDAIFLVMEMIGYTALAVYLDKWSSNPRVMGYFNTFLGYLCCSRASSGPDITTALPDDDDVLAEQDRVLSGGSNSDLVVLSQLSKTYSNGKIAVNQLSLGIPHGECFGLLGINGKFAEPRFLFCRESIFL